MTPEDSQGVIHMALYRILKPMARIAMRYGVSAGAVGELVRRAFVDAAEEMLEAQDTRALTSRLCALTGLYRKEIVRVKALPPIDAHAADDRYNRSARVIAGWLRDPDFRTKAGQPAVLKKDGEQGFSELVRRYSGDMTPRAMLEELTRLQAIDVSKRNTVKLKARAYIPQTNELDTLQILGVDTADLIHTIEHNLGSTGENRRFQRKVAYLHIPERHVEAFQALAAAESQALLERLDGWLASRDTEHHSLGTPGSRVGLGIYLISEENPQHEPGAPSPDSARHDATGRNEDSP